jgi:adenosine deaminase
VRPETFFEITKGTDLPAADLEGVRHALVYGDAAPSPATYREKLKLMGEAFVSAEAIERITCEAIRDAADDNVRYLELRCAPHILALRSGLTLPQVIDAIVAGRRHATEGGDISVGCILSLGRFRRVKDHFPVVKVCMEAGGEVFCGIDIFGDLLNFPVGSYAGIINDARALGMGVTIHAGDVRGASNIIEAIGFLGADRIGHGVRVLEDDEARETARMAEVPFEVCLTANVQTATVPGYESHPFLTMRCEGILAVLCTNDPALSGIALSDEFAAAMEHNEMNFREVQQTILDSIHSAFLPQNERLKLAKEFRKQFADVLPQGQALGTG